MIKNKKQMFIIIGLFALILLLGGFTYAWFSYRGETSVQQMIAGDMYVKLTEGTGEIEVSNVFPETAEEARERNDNYLTFNVVGKNTSNKPVYYEIIIDHGTAKASPKERYYDTDLRFDLVEIDNNGNEISYLLSDVGFDTLVSKRIFVDTIDPGTEDDLVRHYKLRVWVSEDVIISDTESNRNYTTEEYPNRYATIKVIVSGDLTEKGMVGNHALKKAISAKEADTSVQCSNITYEEDGIIYLSGTNDCVDMNYVWYSGKLWRITAIYPDGAMKLITQNNMTNIAFNENGASEFYTSDNNTSYMYKWLNEEFYNTMYNVQDIIDTSKKWNITMPSNTTISTKLTEANMINSNVGLLNSYEYYNSYRCIESMETCSGSSGSTGYLNNDYHWWLINKYSSTSVWIVDNYGEGGNSGDLVNSYSVRPSIIIKKSIRFSGDGTINNPYKMVEDKTKGQVNDRINDRLSGEYVKLKNGNTEQLFRIVSVDNSKTKIVATDYADNKALKKYATNSNDGLWGSGTTTDSGTWYSYLNDSTNGYLKNLKDNYGELFDSGIYYLGANGYNYKLVVCANTASGNTRVCDKTSDKGTFDIGILRYGEMFAAQQGDSSNALNMWLINRNASSGVFTVWNVMNLGMAFYNSASGTRAVYPTVHLKENVIIKSGSGTENDPYVVGLPETSGETASGE